MAKISVIFILSLIFVKGTFANNNLSEAIKNSAISGEARAFYFDRDTKTIHKDILATGIMLKLETSDFYGLKIGATTQLATNPFINSEAKKLFRNDMVNEGVRFSESYFDHTYSNTNLRGGRTFLSTPLVAGSGSRLIRESFEGLHLTNKDIQNTTLGFVYVDKFQARTNKKGDIGNFEDYKDGVYSIYIKNNSINNLNLISSFAKIDDYIKNESNLDIYYAEAIYKNNLQELNYDLNAQYWLNKYNSQNVDKIDGYALKFGLNYLDFSSYLAYSKISNDKVNINQLLHGVGNGSDIIYTNSLISSYNYDPNMKAYAFNLEYKIAQALKLGTIFTYTNTNYTNNNGIKEVLYSGVYANVDLNNILNGLNSVIQYEKLSEDKEGDELRIKLVYKF